MPDSSSKTDNGNVIRLSGLLAVALGVFGLLVGAALMYSSMQGELQAERATGAAEDQARSIAASLNGIQEALDNPEVVDIARAILAGETDQEDALRAAVRRRGVPNIIDVTVFPEAVESVPLGEYPQPDFTVIEMLLEARSRGRAPIQVHYPGQPSENLALAQAIEVNAGVEGILFLRVPVSLVSSLLTVSSFLDAVAIVQNSGNQSYTLKSLGETSGQLESTPIAGSRLSLNWTRRSFASSISKQAAVIVIAIGIILLMGGLLVRKRFGALQAAVPGSKRKPRKANSSTDKTEPASVRPSKTKPKVQVKALKTEKQSPSAPKAEPEPELEDLPDWLLDSDQIDQSDAPLGGEASMSNSSGAQIESIDDTLGDELRKPPSDNDVDSDTVSFDNDEEGLFEPEEGRYLTDKALDEPLGSESGLELDSGSD